MGDFASANGRSDAAAIRGSLTGPFAVDSLFRRHFALVHRFLRVRAGDSDTDDLAAQTFEVAFRRRGDYDPSRLDARPWLLGIATRVLSEHHRKRRRHALALRRMPPPQEATPPELLAELTEARDSAPALRAALADVREDDRDLLPEALELARSRQTIGGGISGWFVVELSDARRAKEPVRFEALSPDGTVVGRRPLPEGA